MTPIRRGHIFFTQFGTVAEVSGAPSLEIARHRPAVVLSIDDINRVSDRTPFFAVVVPGTTGSSAFRPFRTNVLVQPEESGLREPTVFLAHQVRSVDTRRLDPTPAGKLSDTALARLEDAIRYSLGLGP